MSYPSKSHFFVSVWYPKGITVPKLKILPEKEGTGRNKSLINLSVLEYLL